MVYSQIHVRALFTRREGDRKALPSPHLISTLLPKNLLPQCIIVLILNLQNNILCIRKPRIIKVPLKSHNKVRKHSKVLVIVKVAVGTSLNCIVYVYKRTAGRTVSCSSINIMDSGSFYCPPSSLTSGFCLIR